MKTKIASCLLLSFLFCLKGYSQLDSIYFHKGNALAVNLTKIGDLTVTYKYPNEDAENEVGKYAIQKIVIGKSGRVEEVTEKIVITGENDWEKVVILDNVNQTAGLKKGKEVAGKTSFINYRSAAGGDKKALERIKRDAASQNAAFILISEDKNFNLGNSWGGSQSKKKGICYSY